MAAPMEKVSVTFQENIAIICWNCGENRFNPTSVKALHGALDLVERNGNVQALIITGNGKFFSNGLDLTDIDQLWINYNAAADITCRILTFPMPTVAAINGHAFAGGALFALAHDYAVMQTDQGWLSLNEVYLGATFGEFFKALYSAKVTDPSVRRDLVIYGKRFTAVKAEKARLITKACQKENLMIEAKELAKIAASGNYDRISVQKLKDELYHSILDVKPEYDCDKKMKGQKSKL